MFDRLFAVFRIPAVISAGRTFRAEALRLWPLLAVVCLALLVFGDAAQLAVQLYTLSMVALVLAVAHLVRKSLFPYIDLSTLVDKAEESPAGAAVIFASVIALIIALLCTSARAGEIPAGARQHLPTLQAAAAEHWPGAPLPHTMAGQVEQESSWKARATLKTSRELGRGLTQLTVTYAGDGRERYNAYRDAVRWRQLAAWNWQADPYNPRYQLTYLVLRDKATFATMRRLMATDDDSWRATLVAYNAGEGRVLKRRAVALATGLPADRWAGGLADAHGPAENALLYGRPLWAAVNEYPRVIFVRAAKYQGLL